MCQFISRVFQAVHTVHLLGNCSIGEMVSQQRIKVTLFMAVRKTLWLDNHHLHYVVNSQFGCAATALRT